MAHSPASPDTDGLCFLSDGSLKSSAPAVSCEHRQSSSLLDRFLNYRQVSHRRDAALQQALPAPQSRNAAHNNNRPLGAQQIYDWLTRAPAPPTMTNERRSEQLETCWRVVEGSTARILTCAVFSVFASGLELRVGYLLEVPLHSERVADIHAARALAQNWLTAMRGGISTRNLRNRNVDWQ